MAHSVIAFRSKGITVLSIFAFFDTLPVYFSIAALGDTLGDVLEAAGFLITLAFSTLRGASGKTHSSISMVSATVLFITT